jgi:hypothetical protein
MGRRYFLISPQCRAVTGSPLRSHQSIIGATEKRLSAVFPAFVAVFCISGPIPVCHASA